MAGLLILLVLTVSLLILIFAIILLSFMKENYKMNLLHLLNKIRKLTFSKLIEISWIKRHDSKLPVTNQLFGHIDNNLRNKVIFLQNTDFGADLSKEMLVSLANRLTPSTFNKCVHVFGNEFFFKKVYFIQEGSVTIYSTNGVEICNLNKYDFFGEMELALGMEDRQMSVMTGNKPCSFLTLNETDFYDLLQDCNFNRIMINTAKQRHHLLVITGFINSNIFDN